MFISYVVTHVDFLLLNTWNSGMAQDFLKKFHRLGSTIYFLKYVHMKLSNLK
jgi:hypothetical protein